MKTVSEPREEAMAMGADFAAQASSKDQVAFPFPAPSSSPAVEEDDLIIKEGRLRMASVIMASLR
jgi:hypothetical protein